MSWHPTQADLERYARGQPTLAVFDGVVASHMMTCTDCRATVETVRAAHVAAFERRMERVFARPPAISEAELARDVRFAALLRTLKQGGPAGEDSGVSGAAGEPPTASDDVDLTLAKGAVRDRQARRRGALGRSPASDAALQLTGLLGDRSADLVRAESSGLTDAQVLELESLLRDLFGGLPSHETEAFLRWLRDRHPAYGRRLLYMWREGPIHLPGMVHSLYKGFLRGYQKEGSREAGTWQPTR